MALDELVPTASRIPAFGSSAFCRVQWPPLFSDGMIWSAWWRSGSTRTNRTHTCRAPGIVRPCTHEYGTHALHQQKEGACLWMPIHLRVPRESQPQQREPLVHLGRSFASSQANTVTSSPTPQ